MYSKADLGVSVILAGIGTVMIIASRSLPESSDSLGAAFLPTVLGAVLIGLAVLLAIRAVQSLYQARARTVEQISAAGMMKVFAAVGVLAAFVVALALFPNIGFPIYATIAVFTLTILFGGKANLLSLLVSIALSFGVYLLFRGFFNMPLPAPTWI